MQRAIEGPEKDFFTAAEAAAWLNIHTRQLRRLVREGRIPPPIDMAGSKRWTWMDLVAYTHIAGTLSRCKNLQKRASERKKSAKSGHEEG